MKIHAVALVGLWSFRSVWEMSVIWQMPFLSYERNHLFITFIAWAPCPEFWPIRGENMHGCIFIQWKYIKKNWHTCYPWVTTMYNLTLNSIMWSMFDWLCLKMKSVIIWVDQTVYWCQFASLFNLSFAKHGFFCMDNGVRKTTVCFVAISMWSLTMDGWALAALASQVIFINIELFTIQIVSNQIYIDLLKSS